MFQLNAWLNYEHFEACMGGPTNTDAGVWTYSMCRYVPLASEMLFQLVRMVARELRENVQRFPLGSFAKFYPGARVAGELEDCQIWFLAVGTFSDYWARAGYPHQGIPWFKSLRVCRSCPT